MRDNAKSIQCYIQFLSWCYSFDDAISPWISANVLPYDAPKEESTWQTVRVRTEKDGMKNMVYFVVNYYVKYKMYNKTKFLLGFGCIR